jgi:hypothetical protein
MEKNMNNHTFENIIKESRNLLDRVFNKTLLRETGEWEDDEEGIAQKNYLKKLVAEIEKRTSDRLKLIDVKGFDKYQGPYAIVKIDRKTYHIWLIADKDILWIDHYVKDNTSKRGFEPGFEGTVDDIVDMLNDRKDRDEVFGNRK